MKIKPANPQEAHSWREHDTKRTAEVIDVALGQQSRKQPVTKSGILVEGVAMASRVAQDACRC